MNHHTMKSSRLGLLGLAALGCFSSAAVMADDTGWYVGANLGEAQATIDDKRIAGGLLSSGFTSTTIDDDNRYAGFKVFGGYELSRYFGVEGGYFNLGRFGFKAATTPAGELDGRIKLSGGNLDGVARLPLGAGFSVFGRAGVIYADAEDHFTGNGAVHVLDADRSKDAFNFKFGAGLQYDYTTHIGLRLEAERYRIDDAVGNKGDIDLFSLGLVYRFFGDAPVPVVAVAALPPPAPVVMPPPPPPPLPTVVKLRLSADALFDFDKAVVKPDGQRALDKLVTDLKGATVDGITVTGHTDRLGTHAHNLRLSERRAEAVKDYLVNPGALPADRISVQGIDGSEPVTRPGECVGERETPELIRCLQPDRRVEIEIKATR